MRALGLFQAFPGASQLSLLSVQARGCENTPYDANGKLLVIGLQEKYSLLLLGVTRVCTCNWPIAMPPRQACLPFWSQTSLLSSSRVLK